jgi:hypothetical protein
MAERITIVCDVCSARTAAAFRTKVRWSRESRRKTATDLCQDCADELLERWGQLPKPLFPAEADGRAVPAAAPAT